MNKSINLRAMQEADLAGVCAIESQQAFPWTKGKFADCLQAAYQNIVLEKSRKIIGYGVLSVASNEAEILNIVIDIAHRRQGFGHLLFQQLIKTAEQRGAKKIFLEVRASNNVAIKFYQSIGFIQVGVRKDYYPLTNGREDALILRFDIMSSL